MLPDYIIYDEMKKERERRERERDAERPRLEIPRHMPYLPEESREENEDDGNERGVEIFQF